MRKKRTFPLLLLVALALCPPLHAQALQGRLEGGRLYAVAPQLRFLADRVLVRLQNGATLPIHFQLVAIPVSGGKPLSEVSDRFVLSFDLWEELFSVVQSATPRRTVSHLSVRAAEAWCLENLPLPLPPLPDDSPFVLRLDIRADEPGEESAGDGNSGLSLAGLIDIFSKKAKDQPLRWSSVSGPIRLADLKRKEPRDRSPARKIEGRDPGTGRNRPMRGGRAERRM